MSQVKIRKATLQDEPELRRLYKALLSEVQIFGMDVSPTDENVDIYVENVFKPCIAMGDGTILVAENGVGPIGALFWPVIDTGVTVNERSATGLGVYVDPEYRRNGLATELRKEAFSDLHKQGVESVLGFVHVDNTAGDISAKRAGAIPVGTVLKFPTHA